METFPSLHQLRHLAGCVCVCVLSVDVDIFSSSSHFIIWLVACINFLVSDEVCV